MEHGNLDAMSVARAPNQDGGDVMTTYDNEFMHCEYAVVNEERYALQYLKDHKVLQVFGPFPSWPSFQNVPQIFSVGAGSYEEAKEEAIKWLLTRKMGNSDE